MLQRRQMYVSNASPVATVTPSGAGRSCSVDTMVLMLPGATEAEAAGLVSASAVASAAASVAAL